jgi:hypothetical protein
MGQDDSHIPLELSRAEIVETLDRESRRRLGVSGAELIQRYRAGTLKDCGTVADLLALAQLLTEDDPLFAAA